MRLMVLMLLISNLGKAQNLVPNGSFEDSNPNCPNSVGQLDIVSNWYKTCASADLFAECSSNVQLQIPASQVGYQWAKTGTKYCHFGKSYQELGDQAYSEGITVELVQPLKEGSYCVDFYINTPEYPRYWINELEVALTGSFPNISSTNLETLIPDGQISGLPVDTENWTSVSIQLSANNGDQYLTIGSFPELSSTNFTLKNPSGLFDYAGFFIDDVSLVECGFSLEISDTNLCYSDTLSLSVEQHYDIAYEWKHKGDMISDSSSFSMYPPQEGWYYLRYVDFRGDIYLDSAYVQLENCASLELPNVFTPNNDGKNDFWKPIAEDIDQIEVLIYSRWGQQVFEFSGDYFSFFGWDGHEVPEGTYYTVVRAQTNSGELIDQKGTLTLLR